MVLPPPISNNPEASKLIGVPEMVTPGSPAVRVVPAIEKTVGDRFIVLLPIFRIPAVPKLMGVPEMVIPGLPGERVVPAIVKADGFAVSVCPAAGKTVVMGNCWAVAAALGAAAAGVAKA